MDDVSRRNLLLRMIAAIGSTPDQLKDLQTEMRAIRSRTLVDLPRIDAEPPAKRKRRKTTRNFNRCSECGCPRAGKICMVRSCASFLK